MFTSGAISSRVSLGGSVIEDWEDGSLADSVWSSDDSSAFNWQQTTVNSGSYDLELVSGDAGTDYIFADSADLSANVSRGDVFEFPIRRDGTNGGMVRIQWAIQASSGGHWNESYMFEYAEDRIRLYYIDGTGSFNTMDSWGNSPPTGEWDTVTIDFDSGGDGTITATVTDPSGNQIAQLSGTDTSVDSGNWQITASVSMSDTVYISDITGEGGGESGGGDVDDGTSTGVVEGWEDGSIAASPWSANDDSAAAVQDAVAADGTYALETSPGNSNVTGLFADSADLSAVPSRGDTFRMWLRRDGTISSDLLRVHWCSQMASLSFEPYPESYAYDLRGDRHRMFYIDGNGTYHELASEFIDVQADQWYYTVFDFDSSSDGIIRATIYDASTDDPIGTISAQETTLDAGNCQITMPDGMSDTFWHDAWEIL